MPRGWWGSLTSISRSCWCQAFVCVCETSWDHGWQAYMALAPFLLGRELGPPCASSWFFPWVKPSAPSPCSSSSGLVTTAWAEICNPVMGGHSQVCTVLLSMSKEMPKSQNVKSYMSSITGQGFSGLVSALESQKFMLRPEPEQCYPLFHLCILQPTIMSNGKKNLQN